MKFIFVGGITIKQMSKQKQIDLYRINKVLLVIFFNSLIVYFLDLVGFCKGKNDGISFR